MPLLMLLLAWVGAEVLFNAVKLLVDRARPSSASAVHHFGGLAFPSGHATQAMAVWGMVAALAVLSVNTRRAQLVAWGVAVTTVVAVGLSRVYLGAHWASDVLGGWLLGGLWVLAVVSFVRPGAPRRRDDEPAQSAV